MLAHKHIETQNKNSNIVFDKVPGDKSGGKPSRPGDQHVQGHTSIKEHSMQRTLSNSVHVNYKEHFENKKEVKF